MTEELLASLAFTTNVWLSASSPLFKSSGGAPVSISDNHHQQKLQVVLRSLNVREREVLATSCGCKCKDWSQVCLLLPAIEGQTDQSHLLQDLISNTNFEGVVVLRLDNNNYSDVNNSNLDPWKKGPMGIHSNFLISNSIVATQSWVSCNTLISDTHILPASVVVGCGSVTASPPTAGTLYHNRGEIKLSVGPESGGGRNLVLQPESDMMEVCRQLLTPTASTNEAPHDTTTMASMNIISSHSIVRNTPSIQGIFLASGSSIQAATSVSNAILFPTAAIHNTCIVENVRMQWNSSISDNSRVSDALLMEESHIGPNSLVASSVFGPDVHVSAGEVHNSVLGPNTNAHHQSLVISVLWPLGRGNVGYGANIGSNHTGRIPDQETTSGEGVFWGLSCVIKFPVDLTMAPYSIVAAGTSLPPQRVCMPFSLIVTGSGSDNNILPGWVLSSSPYTIARSEKKYATRRKAKRHNHYTGWKIIRRETIDMCRWARKQLVNVATKGETYVAERAINGIGSNILNEKGRQSGIKTYTECIQKFALEGLMSWLVQQDQAGGIDEMCLHTDRVFSCFGTS